MCNLLSLRKRCQPRMVVYYKLIECNAGNLKKVYMVFNLLLFFIIKYKDMTIFYNSFFNKYSKNKFY